MRIMKKKEKKKRNKREITPGVSSRLSILRGGSSHKESNTVESLIALKKTCQLLIYTPSQWNSRMSRLSGSALDSVQFFHFFSRSKKYFQEIPGSFKGVITTSNINTHLPFLHHWFWMTIFVKHDQEICGNGMMSHAQLCYHFVAIHLPWCGHLRPVRTRCQRTRLVVPLIPTMGKARREWNVNHVSFYW